MNLRERKKGTVWASEGINEDVSESEKKWRKM